MSLTDQELRRDRWRRALAGLHLDSVSHPDFAQGGLSNRLDQTTFRAILLPEDPEANPVEFDAEFWEWFEAKTSVEIGQYPYRLGSRTAASAHAAVIFDSWGGDEKWKRYVAVHSSGAVELSLGESARWEHQRDDQQMAFYNLTSMVAGVWALLELAAESRDRSSIEGPAMLVVACAGTADSHLTNFGEGWIEPPNWQSRDQPCVDTQLLWMLEVSDLDDDDARRAVAFRIGDRIENAWGTKHRRYLARQGDFDGELDVRRINDR